MSKKLFSKNGLLIFLLSLLCVFCTCAFFVGCNSAKTDKTEKTYSYTETDTETISNANFEYGTLGKTADDFPIASPTGWTKSADNSAYSSNVDSGVISVAEWDSVFDKLYADNDFKTFCEKKYKDELEGAETDEDKQEIIRGLYTSPLKYADGADGFMYMLNNYSSRYGAGTAQRLRSSSTVTVKKGEIYQISVWIKTFNLVSSFDADAGANVRFTNAVNGNSQAEFRIDGIKNTDWQKYTVYFVANDNYDCTFNVTLGLGYGNGKNDLMQDYVEGTVFFDDVSVTKITELPDDIIFTDSGDGANSKTLSFGSKNSLSVPAANGFVSAANGIAFKYDMNFETDGYFDAANKVAISSATGALTESNTGIVSHGNANFDPTTGVATLNQASYTLTVKNGAVPFEITTADEDNCEKYMLLSFGIQNKLDKLGSTDITVDIIDVYEYTDEETYTDYAYSEKRAAVAAFSTVSDNDDFEICNIVVRNNFKNQTRKFYLEIVIGPTDVKSVTAAADFASGTVTFTDINVATDFISSEKYDDKADNANYKLYSFFNSEADATVALYAGYNADYSEHDHSATYSLTPASGTVGQIVNNPTAVNGYNGITSDHVYVNENSNETDLNGRLAFKDEDNNEISYAGLINTKYLSPDTEHTPALWNGYSAKDATLAAALAGLYADDDIQPIVIRNKTADHYGFIGAQKTVSASAYAKVTVKLKVYGENAKAYIYLVDTSDMKKEVLAFVSDFKVNTDDGVLNAGLNGTTFTAINHKFMLEIDETAEVGEDNWVEVNFYLATGADAKSFRVEIWNGGRDGSEGTASMGYVIINSIDISTSSAFTEPTSWQSAFDNSSSPLFNRTDDFDAQGNELIAYTRELTETENSFNKDYPDQAVSYKATYVWANNETMIYGIFNTVDPVESNPYDGIEKEEPKESGCAAGSDPSTFWMSFSSIVLAVVLVLAIFALFIKRFHAKRKANKSDAKAQYKVKTRTESQRAINKTKEKKAESSVDTPVASSETVENASGDISDIPANEPAKNADNTENAEQTGDETEQTGYVYGEVQDFGDMTLDLPEENKPESEENKKDE